MDLFLARASHAGVPSAMNGPSVIEAKPKVKLVDVLVLLRPCSATGSYLGGWLHRMVYSLRLLRISASYFVSGFLKISLPMLPN